MAHTAPIILALLLNCCEIFVFRNVYNVSYSTHTVCLAKDIFTVGNFFLLLNMRLYPRGFRRTHWIPRSFVEFLLAVYCIETFLCDFWYPLENFVHCEFQQILRLLRKYSPRTGPVCVVLCNLVEIMSSKDIPEGISVALSAFMTLIIIHGTRALDFGIIGRCGLTDFIQHVKDQICKGLQNFIESFTGYPCCCQTKCPPKPVITCTGPCNLSSRF